MADPARDMVLEAVHFLVEIGKARHPRVSGMDLISFLCRQAAETLAGIVETAGTLTQRHGLLIEIVIQGVESRVSEDFFPAQLIGDCLHVAANIAFLDGCAAVRPTPLSCA